MSEKLWHYIIGDIHGCYEEYIQLENKILEHAQSKGVQPLILSVGDLIDRGPGSKEVVEHFYQGQKKGTHFAIMGNHEQLFLEMLHHFAPHNFSTNQTLYPERFNHYRAAFDSGEGMSQYLSWDEYPIFRKCFMLGQGAYQTFESFGCDPHNVETWTLPEHLIAYMIQLPYVYEHPEFILTHALAQAEDLEMIIKLSKQSQLNPSQIVLWRKMSDSLIWNRQPPEEPPDPVRWHISGHTPVKKAKRYNELKCLQIDTGCVYGGRLIAYCFEGQQYLSIPALQKYF